MRLIVIAEWQEYMEWEENLKWQEYSKWQHYSEWRRMLTLPDRKRPMKQSLNLLVGKEDLLA